jgi:hypothetical protein
MIATYTHQHNASLHKRSGMSSDAFSRPVRIKVNVNVADIYHPYSRHKRLVETDVEKARRVHFSAKPSETARHISQGARGLSATWPH